MNSAVMWQQLGAGTLLPRRGLREAFRRARGEATTLWRKALRAPVVHELVEANASRRFRTAAGNNFYGAFESLEQARAALPEGMPAGYDTPEAGALYRERMETIYPHDYPILFWMKPLLVKARRVFDLGGHVGIANYAYERYLGSLSEVNWVVCDVPAVVAAGRDLAAMRGRRGLSFTTESNHADGADVFLASGSLQYLPAGFLPSLLGRLSAPPAHILLSLVPTTPGPTFYTLNNIHTGICPYLVMNEDELVSSMRHVGYERVDSWSVPGKTLEIPLHPELTLDAYRGFYFRKIG
jgi:putative methyltransferase (TIGR04325 family)